MAISIPKPVPSGPRPIRKAIVFTGNAGVGKSFICNKTFESCGNPRRFKSEDSNLCVTNFLQHDIVNINGQSVTIVDSPGFFDNADIGKGNAADGLNTCKLVKALESIEELHALVFVYEGRFTEPHKIWFDRMNEIMTKANQGQIVLLRNMSKDPTRLDEMKTEMRELGILQKDHEYMMLGYNPDQSDIKKMMDRLVSFVPVKLDSLVVPQVCYKERGESEPYEEEISKVTIDNGEMVKENRQELRIVKEERWSNNIFGAFGLRGPGAKILIDVPKVFDVHSEYWVTKEETTRVVATFVNIYNIRFDGSKDLAEKKMISSREEKYGGK